jgi:hypothetical protein
LPRPETSVNDFDSRCEERSEFDTGFFVPSPERRELLSDIEVGGIFRAFLEPIAKLFKVIAFAGRWKFPMFDKVSVLLTVVGGLLRGSSGTLEVASIAEEELDICESESLLEDAESLKMGRTAVARFFTDDDIFV